MSYADKYSSRSTISADKYTARGTSYSDKYSRDPEAYLLKEDTGFLLLENGMKIVIGGMHFLSKYSSRGTND